MPEERLPRKLAVILHADVIGSTALVQLDESAAHELIQDAFRRLAETVTAYGGIAKEIRGDALVAEFARASDAVTAGIAYQLGNPDTDVDHEDDMRTQLRIGISLGEVIIAEQTVTGAGVVLAQRLEQLAAPGQVVVQGSVAETVPTRLPFEFDNLGEQPLKGFDQPVRAFVARLKPGEEIPEPDFGEGVPENGTGAHQERPRLELPDKPSIAVLPFTNMSGDLEQEYFSDGITEDIIVGLSRIGWLFVIARNSSFVFKGKAVDIRHVASELGVRYVLEGSVRNAIDMVRVTAQLIDAQSTGHLWSERYDRKLDDIFLVQDEIVGSIVHALGAADGVLERSERRRIARASAGNPTAYDFYLQAREQFDRQDDRNFDAAEVLFRKSISLDPGFASAYSALAWLCFLRFKLTRTRSFAEVRGEVSDLALEALRLDSNEYRAHTVLGFLLSHEGRYSQSAAHFDRALSINPNDANVMVWSAEVLIYWGRAEEARMRCERAIRLNPKCPDFYFWLLGFAQFHLGRYEEALDALERMTSPRYARRLLAATYAHLGRMDDARAEAEKYLQIDPEFSISAWVKSENYADPGELERYAGGLRKAGFPG